jgi:hypothetical protein
MNEARKRLLASKEKFDSRVFEKIKNNPRPSSADLWSLSEEKLLNGEELMIFQICSNYVFGQL